MVEKWDERFLRLAQHIAGWSKDPSTQTGAVIVRPDKTIASVGFNGFPRGCNDDPSLYRNRAEKYSRIVHCEMNAILHAREPLIGFTLYTWPLLSCDRCVAHVIQTGIVRAISTPCPYYLMERWGNCLDKTRAMYIEAGVAYDEVELE